MVIKLLMLFVVSVSADEFSVWKTDHYGLYPQLPVVFPWSQQQQCRDDSKLVLAHLANHTLWAHRMVDSSARSPLAILHGNMYGKGNFDECMKVKSPILTHMCSVRIKADVTAMPLPVSDPYLLDPPPLENAWVKIRDSRIDAIKYPRDSVGLSLCVPRSCSLDDVAEALNVYLNHSNAERKLSNRSTYTAEILYGCATDEKEPFTVSEITFWGFSAFLVISIAISTITDTNNTKKASSKGHQLLLAFSLKKNLSNFIVRRESKSTPLDLLHGIRVVTTFIIIVEHRIYLLVNSGSVSNYQEFEEQLRGPNNMVMPQSDLIVDTFFFMAGLLSTYLSLEALSVRFVNPILIIIHRFIRIAPVMMYLVWFCSSALLRLGSGNQWQFVIGTVARSCQQNWWTNLLLVNNYVHPRDMCMVHTWFLACDFHQFICCMFLIALLVKHPRTGKVLLYVLFVVFTIIPIAIVYYNKLIPIIVYNYKFIESPRDDKTFLEIYITSHARSAVYIMGILTGHFFFTHKLAPKRFGMVSSVVIFSLGLSLLLAPMVYGGQYYHPGRPYNVIEASLFSTLRRIVWALGCTALMFTQRFGNIPLIGPFFSSRTMIALSKLTYGAYLVHFTMQLAEYANSKTSNNFAPFDLLKQGCGDVTIALLLALILHVAIEHPIRAVIGILVFSKYTKPHIIPDAICNNKPAQETEPNIDAAGYTARLRLNIS